MDITTVGLEIKELLEGNEVDIERIKSNITTLLQREDLISHDPIDLEKSLICLSKITQVLDDWDNKPWQKAYICYFFNKTFPKVEIYNHISSTYKHEEIKDLILVVDLILDYFVFDDKKVQDFRAGIERLKEETWESCDIVDENEEIKVFLETVEHEGREWELLVIGPAESIDKLKSKLIHALR